MMTPQEVANCTFAKSMVGGYNMASVDDFLDKLTEDYSTLYKENAALKAKLKMTVDKMAEYRESEDAIRSTLLAAQKMSSAMLSEAEKKRDTIITDATSSSKRRLAEIQEKIKEEERRLDAVRAQVDQELEVEHKRLEAGREQLRGFIRDVKAVCSEELAQLELLPELPVEEPKPALTVLPPVQGQEVEEAVQGDDEAEAVQRNLAQTLSAFAPAPEAKPAEKDPFAQDEDDEAPEATRVLNLDDLQFGANYKKS